MLSFAIELAACLWFVCIASYLPPEIGTPSGRSLKLIRSALSMPMYPQIRAENWTLLAG
jgi:hypothetical protein